MDLITLSATAAAAQTAAEAAGGGGGGGGGVAERTDEHYANTVLLLHGDGNPGANNVNNPAPIAQYMALSDDSPNDRQVSTVGTNVYGTDFNPFYYNNGSFSNSFDGTASGAVTITPTDDRTDLSGTVDFTIRFWIFPRSTGQSSFSEIFSRGRGSQYAGYRVGMPSGESTIYFGINYAGSSIGANFSKSSALPLNEWTHVAITREANTMKIYLNGVLDATNASFTGNPTMNSADVVYLGRGSYDASNRQFNGLLNSFELIKGRNLYSANFTPPVAPTEDPTTHGELSVSSDASGDYLQLTDTDFSKYNFGTGPFTMEFWVFYDTLGTTILGQTGWGNVVQIRSNKFEFYQAAASGSSGAYWITGTVNAVVGQWYHVVFQRNDAGVLDLWVNGTREATNSTYASTAMQFHSAKGDICFRYWNGGASSGVDKISNFRIQKGAVYATGTSITVPTAPFTRDANTVLLTCQGKTFQDSSNNNQVISRQGNAHISEIGPFGDGYWSNYFDGNTDNLTSAANADFVLGTGDFTAEAFIRPNAIGGIQVILDLRYSNNASTDNIAILFLNGSALTCFIGANKSPGGDIPVVANKWQHVCIQRISNTLYFAVDGVVSSTTVASSDDLNNASQRATIGGNVDQTTVSMFAGHISNLRLIKGTGIYGTSTFTPPTGPLTTTSQGASASEVSLLTCQSNRFIDNSTSVHSLTRAGDTKIDEDIPFEYLQRQTKLITCQENRFKDIINYRWLQTPSSGAKVTTTSPFSSNASYKTANTGAIYMDGTSFVTVDNQGDSLRFGTEDWTIEFWVYVNESGTAQSTLIGRNATGVVYFPYIYRVATSRVVQLYYGGNMAGSTRALLPFEWTHIAYCRENGTSRVFINGEFQGSGADTINLVDPVKMVIGNNGGTSSSHAFNGYIYGLRVEKGRAKYTSNASFTPTATAPVLANSANTGAISTNQFSTYWPEDTSADYLANTNIMPLSDYALGINDWTIEGWFNLQDTSSVNIIDTRRAGAQGVYPMIWMDASNTLEFWRSGAQRIASRTLSVGKWYHFAFVRSGGTTKLYLDGLKEGADYTDTGDYLFDRLWIGYNTNSTYVYKGWIHGLNMLNGVAKYTSNTAITYSPVSRVGTQSANNYSYYIGSGAAGASAPYISIPSSTDFDFGTGDFTIEAWIYPQSFVTSAGIISSFNDPGSGWRLVLDDSGRIRFDNDGFQTAVTPTGLIKLKNWYHVALTKTSSYINIYINGMRVSYTSNSQTIDRHNSTSLVVIGRNNLNQNNYHFDGNISNLRVVKGTALYTGNSFVPATEPFTTTSQGATASEVKLLTGQASTLIDQSDSNHQLSSVNKTIPVTTFSPFDNGYWSVHFDGTDDYIDIPGQTSALSGQWSLELWFMKQDSSTDVIVSTDTTDQFQLVIQDSGDFHFSYNGTSPIFDVASGTNLHEWFHICVTRDAGNYVRGYINGVLKAYVYNTGNPTLNGFSVGDQRSTGSHDTFGKVSNLRLVVGSIPTSYQSSETSLGTSVFTPPTDYLTRSSQGATASDVELLICQSGALIDNSQANSGIGYAITASGDAKVSRSRPFSTELARDQVLLACQDKEVIKDNSYLDTKFTKTGDVTRSADNPFDNGFWSAKLDGSGDELDIANVDTAFGTSSDFTVEFWFNASTINGAFKGIIDARDSADSDVRPGFWINTSNQLFYDVGGTAKITSTTTIVANRWYHVAAVRNSGTTTLYLNGVSEGTFSDSENYTSTTSFHVGERYTSTAYNFHGYISNIRIVNGTALYTANFTPSTSPFTTTSQGATASEVKLLTCQSSNFADNSSTLNKITEAGNANTRPVFPDTFANTIPQQTTFLTGKFPGSIRNVGFLDESSNNTPIVVSGNATQGSFTPHYPPSGYWSVGDISGSNYIDITNDASFVPGTGDFTVEFFSNQTTIAGYQTAFSLGYNSAGDLAIQTGNGDGRWIVYISGSAIATESSTTVKARQWYHIAVVRNGSNIVIYRDGVSVATGTSSTNINTSTNLRIGTGTAFGNPFLGSISNLRVAKSAVYTSAFTRPSEPLTTSSQSATNVGLLIAKSNRFVDESSESHSLSITGSPKVQSFFPFDLTTSYDAYEHGGSAYFDGSGDELTIEGNNFTLGTSDFTIELWYYKTGKTSNQIIVRIGGSYGVYFAYDGRVFFATTGSGSWNLFNDIDLALQDYAWNHLAFCRNGTTVSIFSNGDRKSTATTSSAIYQADNNIIVGDDNSIGYVCNFRMVVGSYIYDATQSSITVPTSPVRPTTNTVFQLDSTNAGIYDSTAKHVLGSVGTVPQISTGAANTKFGTGSIRTGTGVTSQYLGVKGDSFPAFGTGDFTIEAFVKYNDGTSSNFYDTRPAGVQGLYPSVYVNSNKFKYYTNSADRITGETKTINRWYHVAVVRYNSETKLYVDGRQEGATYADTNNYLTATDRPILGNRNTTGFDGFVDEMRITLGQARYTANFTPMTAASGNKSPG